MFNWITREVPEDLRPAKGIMVGILLGLAAWMMIAALILMVNQ